MSRSAVLILGAGSDMARAIAHKYASAGHDIQLAARQVQRLAADQADIALRHGVAVSLHEFDALDLGTHPGFVQALPSLPGIAICAVGLMGQQGESQTDMQKAALVMRSNFEGPACILALLANAFEQRGHGILVGIASVAGLRGRASNYVYGASKAGFVAFLSGLRNRLARGPVHVVTVLPGFVNTKMTEGMALPRRLMAQPADVADAVFRATQKRRDVIYVKPIWRLIMAIICALPERVFKKTSL